MMINGRAAFRLSVEFVVIIILALIFLALATSFMKSGMEKSQLKLEEQMVLGAPKPQFEISSPQNNQIFEIGDEVTFEAFVYPSKSKIEGYFWDLSGDGAIDNRNEKPTYTYFEPGDYNVTLKLLNDLGGVGSASVIVRVFTKNDKSLDNYQGDPVFFIPFYRTGSSEIEIDNWQQVLKVIPLSRWYDKGGDRNYNLVVIAKESGQSITLSEVGDKLAALGKTNAIVFDMGSSIGEEGQIRKEDIDDITTYFSYWGFYDSVVLVDSGNYEGALIAALFAAYYNSPLVIIDNSNYAGYRELLRDKNIYFINYDPDGCSYCEYINNGEWILYNSYTADELRAGNVNRIIELKSKLFTAD